MSDAVTEAPELDLTLTLPGGTQLPGSTPVVIIGPNGSGKTRRVRDVTAGCPIEFVNALRNTAMQPGVPAMSYVDAEKNYTGQRNQSRKNHWTLHSEFDFLLATLFAEHATSAIKFRDATKAGQATPDTIDALQRIRDLWGNVFPGREFTVEDYRPVITSTISGETVQYAAQTMSDGERAAIYLAGRVLRAEAGVVVVDEPETHLHSLLAARFWDELESSRPDVRFIYITHDVSFARSRRAATYVIASPTDGLKVVELQDGLPNDVAGILLGTASLSFYARRIVLCEGEADHRDSHFFGAWFHDTGTVVRAVGGSEMVHRCMSALQGGWLVANVEAIGLMDRDFHPDEYVQALPPALNCLPVHEIESLYCLPAVVSAAAAHLGTGFDETDYLKRLRDSVSDAEKHKVILERWKRRVEPQLVSVVASVQTRTDSLDTVVDALPAVFESASWGFSPTDLLQEEKTRVEAAVTDGPIEDLLRLLPGKGLLAVAAQFVGLQPEAYIGLVNGSLRAAPGLEALGANVEAALVNLLPPRATPDV